MKIAIQGGRASFHDIAARKFFESRQIDTLECRTFKEVCNAINTEQVDAGIMAMENSLAGIILNNFSLINENELKVSGEIKLRIELNLMALKGQSVNDIHTIKSHYMALMQCSEYLDAYPDMKIVETEDTADSAKEIYEGQEKGVAAIAGRSAAKIYDLDLLAENIHTLKQNYTRFLILRKKDKYEISSPEKATICFQVKHRVGGLTDVLKTIVDNKLNLSSIHSVPIIGQPDEYAFYVDCEWDDYQNFLNNVEAIKPMVTYLNVMGVYPKGVRVYDSPGSQQNS